MQVELLLEKNDINVNLTLKDGQTSLLVASHEGHVDIVEKLLAHPDIDITKTTTQKSSFNNVDAGKTAEDAASAAGHKEIVTLLKNHVGNNKPRRNFLFLFT